MNHGFGHEVPPRHARQVHQQVTRYLVVISSGEVPLVRLCRADHEQVAEFDAGTEEVAVMIQGAEAREGATGPEWDKALAGHSAAERAAATVYVLAV